MATGEIHAELPEVVVQLLLEATVAFHHPQMVLAHKTENRADLLKTLVVMLAGLHDTKELNK